MMLNQMEDVMLHKVCGGNYGDEDRDNNSSQSMYEVGQYVEVYDGWIHTWTTRSKIVEKKFEDGHWNYKVLWQQKMMHDFDPVVKVGDMKDYTGWVTATKIER